MMMHSMLQVMLELAAVVQVSQTEDSGTQGHTWSRRIEVNSTQTPTIYILCGSSVPTDSSIAVQYNGRWFWIADTDIRSKSVFAAVMLLFNISNIGIKRNGTNRNHTGDSKIALYYLDAADL